MKKSAQERTRRVLGRMKLLQRQKRQRHLQGLTLTCLCLSAGLLRMVPLGKSVQTATPSAAGAILMFSNAGGYVLAGLVAFTLGVIVTLLCVWASYKNI